MFFEQIFEGCIVMDLFVYNYLDEVRNIILGQIDIQSFIYDDTDVNDYLNDISNNEDLNEYEDNKEHQEEDSSEYEDNKEYYHNPWNMNLA